MELSFILPREAAMLRSRPFFSIASAFLPAVYGGDALSAAIEIALRVDEGSVEIIAARERAHALRAAAPAPASMPGVWIEVAGRKGEHLRRIHLGDPLLLPYDDMRDGAAGLGLGRVEERTLFIPVPLPPGAHEIRVSGDRGELLDEIELRDLSRLIESPVAVPDAPPTEAVRITGDSKNRLDLLFMGDGYRVEEWDRFRSDVDACVAALLGSQPFLTYPESINIWRLPLRSAESGADHPCDGIFRQTRLGATYDWPACRTRMMSYDYFDAWLTATRALPAWDDLIVLVNDPERAGAMPPFAPGPVYSNRDFDYLTVHEWIGHDLAGLMDEYDATDDVGPIGLPYSPNCSLSRLFPPWRHWIREGEPGIGAFPSCAFDNLYRPTDVSCVMRVFWPLGFDAFCRERAIKGLFRVIHPIDGSDPPARDLVAIGAGEEREFEVTTIDPVGHSLHFVWSLDGTIVQAGDENRFSLEGGDLSPGSHSLRVDVHDPNEMVLRDRRNLMDDRISWDVLRE